MLGRLDATRRLRQAVSGLACQRCAPSDLQDEKSTVAYVNNDRCCDCVPSGFRPVAIEAAVEFRDRSRRPMPQQRQPPALSGHEVRLERVSQVRWSHCPGPLAKPWWRTIPSNRVDVRNSPAPVRSYGHSRRSGVKPRPSPARLVRGLRRSDRDRRHRRRVLP
jgi:hypothetical protein